MSHNILKSFFFWSNILFYFFSLFEREGKETRKHCKCELYCLSIVACSSTPPTLSKTSMYANHISLKSRHIAILESWFYNGMLILLTWVNGINHLFWMNCPQAQVRRTGLPRISTLCKTHEPQFHSRMPNTTYSFRPVCTSHIWNLNNMAWQSLLHF